MTDNENQTGPAPAPSGKKTRNHAIWLGPLVVFGGAVSYFTFFAQYPALRDTPWINLPLVMLGALIACVGVWRAFTKPSIYRGKVLGTISLAFSLLLAGLFGAYITYISYQLPEPTAVTSQLESAPDFTLNDQEGNPVSLSDFNGKKLIVTFYRGYW